MTGQVHIDGVGGTHGACLWLALAVDGPHHAGTVGCIACYELILHLHLIGVEHRLILGIQDAKNGSGCGVHRGGLRLFGGF